MIEKPSTFKQLKEQFQDIVNLGETMKQMKEKRDLDEAIQKAC